MPRFRTFAAALLVGGALFAAGAFAQGIGRWTTGSPMPSARTEVAVAEVGGKIYVVGGFRGERELEVYDPAADRWSRGASIPRALHHAAAVGLNGKLFVIGGFVEGWTPTDDVHEYDPASDRWQRLAALPTTRGALAAAVLDGKIHAVGGIGGRNFRTGGGKVVGLDGPAPPKRVAITEWDSLEQAEASSNRRPGLTLARTVTRRSRPSANMRSKQ